MKKVIMMASMAAMSCLGGITVNCDRASHYYHVGEEAEIRIACEPKAVLQVELTSDGEALLERREITVDASETYVFRYSLGRPGFLRCSVSGKGLEKRMLGMAFDPEQIRPALPEPDDFQDFWDKAFVALDAVPANFKMTEVPEESTADAKYYELECDNVNGSKHYGYLKLPISEKKLPLLVYVEGAGRGQELEDFKVHAANVERFISFPVGILTINVHPYKPERKRADHIKQHEEFVKQLGVRSYWLDNIAADDLTNNFFYRAILGCKRMCDLISALPQIDSGHIAYLGVSQGGMFGLYLTAICPQIRAAFCGVPAFCDCGGFLTGQHTTQSQIAELKNHVPLLRYFDTVNFARRIQVPVFISAGYIDATCPPASVFAAANSLGGPKLVFHKVLNAHQDGPVEYEPLYWTYVASYLKME